MKKTSFAVLALVLGLTVFMGCKKQEAPTQSQAPAVSEEQPKAPAEQTAPATPAAPPEAPAPSNR